MLKNILIFLLILLFSTIIFANEEYINEVPFLLNATGHIGFDVKEGYLYAENNARFEYQGLIIEGDKIAVYTAEERLIAEGDEINIYSDGEKIQGSYLDFNYGEETGYLADASTDFDELFFKGERINLHSDQDYNYSIDKASITPCVLPDPHYSFQAGAVKIYPGEKIVANNIWLRIGGYRVLYLPSYTARYNQSTGEFDSITPIPSISYNSSDGLNMNISYPYQISDNFTGELEAEINQKGDKGVELTNKYSLSPTINIISNYLYDVEYNEENVDRSSEISTGFEYQNNSLMIAPNYVYDFNTKKSMVDINANYNYQKIRLNYFNRYINNEINKENYSISYLGRYPIELLYREGYSLDYLPYLRIRNLRSELSGFNLNSTLGIGRVSKGSHTLNKADIDIDLSRTLLSNNNYNLDLRFKSESNLYFEEEQISFIEHYNYYNFEVLGNYKQQAADNISLRYNLAYNYNWDDGQAYLNEQKKIGQNIKPGFQLRYDKPEEYSAWVIKINSNYSLTNQELSKMTLSLERELDCYAYYFDLDILKKSFEIGIDF